MKVIDKEIAFNSFCGLPLGMIATITTVGITKFYLVLADYGTVNELYCSQLLYTQFLRSNMKPIAGDSGSCVINFFTIWIVFFMYCFTQAERKFFKMALQKGT